MSKIDKLNFPLDLVLWYRVYAFNQGLKLMSTVLTSMIDMCRDGMTTVTQVKTSVLFAVVSSVAICFSFSGLSFAHEPIFMASTEAPGKGAFDLHTGIESTKQGDERKFELEQEITYGITRDLAVALSFPFARHEKFKEEGQEDKNGIKDPAIKVKWRFWDKDMPGIKYSSAVILKSTIPIGDGNGRLGRKKPGALIALAHGRESLDWYYVVDVRYLYHQKDNGNRPENKLHLDAAYGIRPELRAMEETDIVYFFELNYLHENKAKINGFSNPDSGGDFVFFSPEVLISPTNRIMLRGGVQIPLIQKLNGKQKPRENRLRLKVELRF